MAAVAYHLEAVTGNSRFYCLPLVDFGYALIDYECSTVTIGLKRYLLSGRHFELLVILLFAEGAIVSKEGLAARLSLRGGRDSVNRLVRQLRATMWKHNQLNLIEILPDGYRVRPSERCPS